MSSFYLHSDGGANSAGGSGVLSTDAPRSEKPDVFTADPADPVPAVAAVNGRKPFEVIWGPVDQAPMEQRKDVLVYSTPPLTRSLRFAGPLRAELSVQASTPDSDWVVKLVDVSPDGFAQNLAAGIQRSSFARTGKVTPGSGYKIEVDLGHAAARIAPGHRLRVEVTGSYFPLFDRNTNTGEGPFSARTMVARQTVHHSAGSASRVLIPLIEEKP
jgi:putative CocE/NonD family hydrolase